MPVSKTEVLLACKRVLAAKKSVLIDALRQVEESLLSETKSTAGDKHETGRAHMQTEQGKLLGLLNELLEMETELRSVDGKNKGVVSKGSLVYTDRGWFLMGIPLGRLEVNGETVFAVSLRSPLGQEMAGRKKNEKFELAGKGYHILELA